VTLTITDYCGASASCAAAVTVTNTPPVAQCRAFSGFAGESCCITVNVADIDDGSRDPMGQMTLPRSVSPSWMVGQ